MNWLLIIILTTGVIKKTKFNSEDVCEAVKKDVVALHNPKFVKVKCVYDKK